MNKENCTIGGWNQHRDEASKVEIGLDWNKLCDILEIIDPEKFYKDGIYRFGVLAGYIIKEEDDLIVRK